MNNLLVILDPLKVSLTNMQQTITQLWEAQVTLGVTNNNAKKHHIPVSYGGERAEDIALLAAYTGLTKQEIIQRHSEAEYTVYALGSQPGLPYLGGLDPKLMMPRRETPRTRVEAGAIIIGGSQASILSCTSACGWHIIGHTDVTCFHPENTPPALFSPGDTVKFFVKEVHA